MAQRKSPQAGKSAAKKVAPRAGSGESAEPAGQSAENAAENAVGDEAPPTAGTIRITLPKAAAKAAGAAEPAEATEPAEPADEGAVAEADVAGEPATPPAKAPAKAAAPAKATPAKATPATSAAKKAAGRPGARPGGAKGPGGRSGAAKGSSRGPAKKPGKSIVNQKQTPWGMIISVIAVLAFAGAIIGVVIATHKSSSSAAGGNSCSNDTMIGNNKTYTYLNELVCAKDIKGVTFKQEPNRQHIEGHITYDSTPPVGGNHSQYWADCTGTVYPQAIANENAVHMLEHGAIWITYNANEIQGAALSKLASYVSGVDRMALSPYPNLSTPISLQAWGYQLRVSSATDPRIAQFIAALKYNPKTTPEYGATCSQPTFKQHPSTFGNPLWEPASGNSPNAVMSGAP